MDLFYAVSEERANVRIFSGATLLPGTPRGLGNMNERTVSISCIAAVGLWVLTFLLIFVGTVVAFVDHREYLAIALAFMAHGLACSAAAATVSIRYMFKKQNRYMRAAFDLGRDAGSAPVRSMR